MSLRDGTSFRLAVDVVDVDALGQIIEFVIKVLTGLTQSRVDMIILDAALACLELRSQILVIESVVEAHLKVAWLMIHFPVGDTVSNDHTL